MASQDILSFILSQVTQAGGAKADLQGKPPGYPREHGFLKCSLCGVQIHLDIPVRGLKQVQPWYIHITATVTWSGKLYHIECDPSMSAHPGDMI